ncbi:hypothetical protein GX48_06756 [Paracoccidioides brasiliensis]|nr:hypothetical protein GX48_06756 [Paracoccidioides brasiliensis]
MDQCGEHCSPCMKDTFVCFGYATEAEANMLDRGCKVALFLELERCLHVRAQDASQMSHRLSTLSASYRFTYRAIVRVGRCTSSTVDSDNRRGFM